jgi:predicted RNA-binding protein YlxR (DUF448 family)
MAAGARAQTGAERVADDAAERTCAVTRVCRERDELIRFVRAPDGQVVADLACRLPGRGVWITCARDTVETAAKSGIFARGFRKPAKASPTLAADVELLIKKRLTEALALANKAGLVVAGFGKVEAEIMQGGVVAVLHGSNAAADGCRKLDQRLHAARRDGVAGTSLDKAVEIIDLLTIDELSLVMGRANVVHAALKAGGASARLSKEAWRLRRYRNGLQSYEARSQLTPSHEAIPSAVTTIDVERLKPHNADEALQNSESNTDRV